MISSGSITSHSFAALPFLYGIQLGLSEKKINATLFCVYSCLGCYPLRGAVFLLPWPTSVMMVQASLNMFNFGWMSQTERGEGANTHGFVTNVKREEVSAAQGMGPARSSRQHTPQVVTPASVHCWWLHHSFCGMWAACTSAHNLCGTRGVFCSTVNIPALCSASIVLIHIADWTFCDIM